MNCASNPSKLAAPARRDVIVEFPVVGGRTSRMNHVRVIAYFDSLGRVVSVPSSRCGWANGSCRSHRYSGSAG